MKTQQKQNQKELNDPQFKESVIRHSPLTVDGKPQQECWAHFHAGYLTSDGQPACLQPGQFIPIWRIGRNGRWAMQTPFNVKVVSALVMNGRLLVKGGDLKLSSHPEIIEWVEGAPIKGPGSELRFPGGVRRINPGHSPALYANNAAYDKRGVTAKVFASNYGDCRLYTGACPLEIVARIDQVRDELPLADKMRVMHDVVRDDCAAVGYALPFPVILSNEEEMLLKDYPSSWTDALERLCHAFGITEVGVRYFAQEDVEVTDKISDSTPKEVYRSLMSKSELGVSLLDPELYERMLPFMSGKLDPEFLFSGQ